MLNIASLIIGIIALLFAVVAFLPLLGWANWLDHPAGADRRRGGHGVAQ